VKTKSKACAQKAVKFGLKILFTVSSSPAKAYSLPKFKICTRAAAAQRKFATEPFDLIPGATHWFERDGDVECNTIWANSVISSITHLQAPKGYYPSREEQDTP
jgi:hypothetical protein